jgi:hypothetical protein
MAYRMSRGKSAARIGLRSHSFIVVFNRFRLGGLHSDTPVLVPVWKVQARVIRSVRVGSWGLFSFPSHSWRKLLTWASRLAPPALSPAGRFRIGAGRARRMDPPGWVVQVTIPRPFRPAPARCPWALRQTSGVDGRRARYQRRLMVISIVERCRGLASEQRREDRSVRCCHGDDAGQCAAQGR